MEKYGTYSRMSSTVGVAGMGLVVQACSWKGVCVPGWLAVVPLGAEARAHGHSRLTSLIGSHCGARLSRRKECNVKTALHKTQFSHIYMYMCAYQHAFSCMIMAQTSAG